MSHKHLKVFTASWCGPCAQIKPYLNELPIPVVEVDIEKEKAIAEMHLVRGVPTLKLYDGTQLVKTHVGTLTRADLGKFIA